MFGADADGFQSGEMDDCIEILDREQACRLLDITEIEIRDRNLPAGDAVHAFHDVAGAVREIFGDDDMVAGREQADDSVRADVSAAPCDQYPHRGSVPMGPNDPRSQMWSLSGIRVR